MPTDTDASEAITARLPPVLEAAARDAATVDEAGSYPEAALAALRSSGLLGLTLPTEVGGMGAGPSEFVDVTQRLAGACGSTAMIYLMHVVAAMPLAAARPTGHADVLFKLASGELLGTLAFSEKGPGATSGLRCHKPSGWPIGSTCSPTSHGSRRPAGRTSRGEHAHPRRRRRH